MKINHLFTNTMFKMYNVFWRIIIKYIIIQQNISMYKGLYVYIFDIYIYIYSTDIINLVCIIISIFSLHAYI